MQTQLLLLQYFVVVSMFCLCPLKICEAVISMATFYKNAVIWCQRHNIQWLNFGLIGKVLKKNFKEYYISIFHIKDRFGLKEVVDYLNWNGLYWNDFIHNMDLWYYDYFQSSLCWLRCHPKKERKTLWVTNLLSADHIENAYYKLKYI